MPKRSLIIVIAIMAVLCLIVGACAATKKAPSKSKPAPKPPALPKILELGADKCIPCKMMVPVLNELRTEYNGKLQVEFIDVWKDSKAKEKYKVRMIPTQILYDSKGKELVRHTGFWSKEDILAAFKKHGIKLTPNTPPKKK
jgi:thioredoxin 1